MKKPFFILCTFVFLAGCGNRDSAQPDNLLASNNFEQLEGWTAETPLPSLSREKAHSGNFAMRVGPGVEYANGYINTLGKLSPTRLGQIKVKAWVFVAEGNTSAVIVTQLLDAAAGSKPLLWEALPLEKATSKRNEWVEVEKTISLPANVGPNTKLYVYLWRGASPTVAYIDDMQILRP